MGLSRKLQILFGKPAEFLLQVAIDRPRKKTQKKNKPTKKLSFQKPSKHMDASKNRGGPPKWMVYNGKPY